MTEEKIISRNIKSKIKIGDKFDRWTVLENFEVVGRRTYFKCKCECGTIRAVRGSRLYNGGTKSCGCLRIKRITKHRMTGTSEYNTWDAMIQRCTNLNNSAYENYGGRGITVCPEWLHSFVVFFKDMGKRPKGLTLERKDNDLGYFKENCSWAPYTEQIRNRRINGNNKTGINGVCWYKPIQKYHVQITANYKSYHIGYFASLEDAKTARITAERKYWGWERK